MYRRDGGVRSSRKSIVAAAAVVDRGVHSLLYTHIYTYIIYTSIYRFHDEDIAADGTRDITTTADRARGLNICPSTCTTHTRLLHTLHGPLNNHVTLYTQTHRFECVVCVCFIVFARIPGLINRNNNDSRTKCSYYNNVIYLIYSS